MTKPVDVLIACFERPLHLWACLDSLYRHTRHPHRFTLVDMASADPMVPRVIASFERRGMFVNVIRAARNDPAELWNVASAFARTGEFLGYADGDVTVEDVEPCWLGTFVTLMEQHPRLAMVGPTVDKRDFVSWQRARSLEPGLDEAQLAELIKLHSPERDQDVGGTEGESLVHPHNPPGRLVLMRCAALLKIGGGTDGFLDRKFRDAGYETGLAVNVRHRHLSLLNLFDYPEYDTAGREAFFRASNALGGDTIP